MTAFRRRASFAFKLAGTIKVFFGVHVISHMCPNWSKTGFASGLLQSERRPSISVVWRQSAGSCLGDLRGSTSASGSDVALGYQVGQPVLVGLRIERVKVLAYKDVHQAEGRASEASWLTTLRWLTFSEGISMFDFPQMGFSTQLLLQTRRDWRQTEQRRLAEDNRWWTLDLSVGFGLQGLNGPGPVSTTEEQILCA